MKFLSNEIRSILKDKNFVSHIEALISFGRKCFDSVEHGEKEILSSILMKSIGNDLFDILDINGYEDLDIYDVDSEIIISKIDEKFSDDINMLMQEIIENKKYDNRIENGFVSIVDRNNGELNWVRNY